MNSPDPSPHPTGEAARAASSHGPRRTFVGFRQPRQRDERHLDFIRSLPCLVCGNNIETQAAHIRLADFRAAKRYVGKGEKADDVWTLPLCGRHHDEQHHVGERKFWGVVGIDPVFVALALWRASGDVDAGEQIVRHAR